MLPAFLDATGSTLSVIARMKLSAELAGLVKKKLTLGKSGPMAAIQGAKVSKEILQVLGRMGIDLSGNGHEKKAFALEGGPEPIEQPRKLTAHLYDFDPIRKSSERRKDNSAAMALLKAVEKGDLMPDDLTDEQKASLARYSGTGGNLIGADGKKGSAYEYYTPKPIAHGMWDLLGELGFKGGKVLDPCAGVGIFGATAPGNTAIESVELSETSGRVNQLVNSGPGYNAIISPFEAVASRTADEIYDAVVSNVPFGSVHDRGANRKLDPLYQDEPLETYFILRSLRKLKPGGLAAFIVPPRVVSARGGREEKLRVMASYMAEFRGAYRLPNSVFGTADADTITDVIVFRKFGRDMLGKIEELKEQAPDMLVTSHVQWVEFISGNYFKGEGRKFVLGEFQAKDPNKFRDVDRVISHHSVADIAKMMRKFPASRIDWALLNATETEPIVYNDGDTTTLAGQTLEMRDGVWVPLGKPAESSRFDEIGQYLTDPVVALSNKVTWPMVRDFVAYMEANSLGLDVPDWVRQSVKDIGLLADGDQAKFFGALLAGLSAVQVTQHHSSETGFDYHAEYPQVSEAMMAASAVSKRAPAGFSRLSKAGFVKVSILYDRQHGFSALWRGDVQESTERMDLSEEDKVKALKYTSQGITLDVGALKHIYGEEFDPHKDDDWCLNHDGTKATRADDYYVGNLGDFLARIDKHIAGATGPLREKLLRQKAAATDRVIKFNPSELRFNLFSPFITIEEKAEFLRRFLHDAFVVAYDNDGDKVIICDIGSPKSERERQLKRFAEYLKTGNLTTRTSEDEARANPNLETQRRKTLRDMAASTAAQFDQWVKSNLVIMERLNGAANDPARVYFREVEDTEALEIAGMAEGLNLHGYQNAEVRRQARSFGGINGFDVGLGKTFTALACAQYVHSIGVKKKTFFVVPNSVLSNWRREAGRAYASLDDCLFVGLDFNEKTGQASVNSASYARDFNRVLENRHAKVFCTLEAFKTIPLKDATIDAYEAHLKAVDPSYAGSDRKAESEQADSKLSEVTTGTGAKSSAIPYFEDMGADSLVMDEAHMFKNSKNTVEFSGAKFLSVAEASQRGLDIQMKAWFIRNGSELKDGVLLLTATPITNSPLEIYSMLSLAVGEQKVHDMTMGAKGADAFMQTMCDIQDDEEMTIDGLVKPYRVFRGLQNVNLLRNALATVANIKTGKDVKASGDDLKLPDAPENKSSVQLTPATVDLLRKYKMAYRAARYTVGAAAKDSEAPTEEEMNAMMEVSGKFGEPLELIAHPFNLINKMTMVIADPELDERATFYDFPAEQAKEAAAAIGAFNKLAKAEIRRLPGPWTRSEAVIGAKTIKDGDSEIKMVRIRVEAAITKGRIVVDTMDTNIQAEFEKAAAKAGLSLDCAIPPKYASLMDNVRKEEAHPRSRSGQVKQLIFCDILASHNKIRRLLTRHAGFKETEIAIISGQAIKNPEQMQGIQDGFNADGEDNKYRIIIANEKAEVGINLQKGTQAIHHLTIGWTPDSQIQRNGRGVRQGNTTESVSIYHYDADGTFDSYKRTLTGKKSDWIGAVMDRHGSNDVAVAGGLSNDQLDELIQSMGDAGAVDAIRQRAEEKERQARADTAKARQVINLRTAATQRDFQKKYDTAAKWITEKAMALYDLRKSLQVMGRRAADPGKMAPATLIKLRGRIAEAQATVAAMVRDIDASADFTKKEYYSYAAKTVETKHGILELLDAKSHYSTASKIRESIESSVRYSLTAKEGSTLDQDWQSEIAAAESMAQEALKDFERIAGGPDAAMPADVASAFKEGHAEVMDGAVYVKGMFCRGKDGTLFVLNTASTYARFPSVSGAPVAFAVTKGFTFIMFGSPEYEEALSEAAAIDDAAEDVKPYNVASLFGSIVPAVALRRKQPTLVSYSATSIKLPAPQFPYPVNPDDERLSKAVRDIGKAQPAIAAWADLTTVQVPSEIVVETISGGSSSAAKFSALADWARAHATPLSRRDYGVVGFGNDHPSNARSISLCLEGCAKWPSDAVARIDGASDQAGLVEVGNALIAEAYGAFLVLDHVESFAEAAPYALRNAYNLRVVAIKREAEVLAMEQARLERIAAEPEAPAPEPAAAPAPVPTVGAGIAPNAKGLIGISGDTRPNKETIKDAAKAVGGYARWVSSDCVWAVPAKAWDYLVQHHPDVAKVLEPVPV